MIWLFLFLIFAWPAQAAWEICITPELHEATLGIMQPTAVKEISLNDAAAKEFVAWYKDSRFLPVYRIGHGDEITVHSKPGSDEVFVAVFLEDCMQTYLYLPAKAFYQRYPGT